MSRQYTGKRERAVTSPDVELATEAIILTNTLNI